MAAFGLNLKYDICRIEGCRPAWQYLFNVPTEASPQPLYPWLDHGLYANKHFGVFLNLIL